MTVEAQWLDFQQFSKHLLRSYNITSRPTWDQHKTYRWAISLSSKWSLSGDGSRYDLKMGKKIFLNKIRVFLDLSVHKYYNSILFHQFG